jgi:hypothetical protein
MSFIHNPEGVAFAIESFHPFGITSQAFSRYNHDIPSGLIRQILAMTIASIKTLRNRKSSIVNKYELAS